MHDRAILKDKQNEMIRKEEKSRTKIKDLENSALPQTSCDSKQENM